MRMKPNTLTCKFRYAGLKKKLISPYAYLPLEEIYNKHQEGIQYKELAEEYNVPYKTLRLHLRRAGFVSDKDKVIRVDLKKAWERYNDGESQVVLGKEYGIGSKELSRRFSKASYKKPPRKIEQYSFGEIEELRIKEGGKLQEVAEKLDLKYCSLKRWYYKRNLTTRGYKLVHNDFFSAIDKPEKAYFLGFIYTDGYLNEERDFFRIKINNIDRHILEHFASLLFAGDRNIRRWFEANREVCALAVTSKQIANDLIKHGVRQRKANSILFPTTIDPGMMRHFIRGYFDGDGSVCKIKEGPCGSVIRLGFVSNSYQFINDLRSYFIEMGFHPTKLYLSDETFRMNMGRKADMIKFRDFLYQDVSDKLYLKRKYNKFLNIDDGKSNPHLPKFTDEYRKRIYERVKDYHKRDKYSRYIECIVTDLLTKEQVHKRTIKEACLELSINYDSAKVIWKRNPNAVYLGRYVITFPRDI